MAGVGRINSNRVFVICNRISIPSRTKSMIMCITTAIDVEMKPR